MSDKELIAVWPRDFLIPIINKEIDALLKHLTRDDSWKGCFGVQVHAEGIVQRMKRGKVAGKLWEKAFSGVDDDYVAGLVVEVALTRGLAVLHNGVQMVIEERKDGQS